MLKLLLDSKTHFNTKHQYANYFYVGRDISLRNYFVKCRHNQALTFVFTSLWLKRLNGMRRKTI